MNMFEKYLNMTWFSKNATFNQDIWNHSGNYEARTNNNVEGFHSKIHKLLKKAHPNFFEILNIFKKIQLENEIDIKIYLACGKERLKIARYLQSHLSILDLRNGFLNRSISLYKYMQECV